MTALPQQVETNLDQLATTARRYVGNAPHWLAPVREKALSRFVEMGWPTMKDEDWRFTNIEPIRTTSFREPDGDGLPEAGAGAEGVGRNTVERFAFPGLTCHTLVFVNGRLAPKLNDIRDLPEGVRVARLGDAFASNRDLVAKYLTKLAAFEHDPFAALNTAMLGDGVFVHVPDGAVVDEPIHLVNIATATPEPVMTHPRNLVVVGRNGRVNVIEHYVALTDGPYLTNAVTEIAAGDDSFVGHYMIEDESLAAFNVSTLAIRQGRHSDVRSHTVLLGGRLVRNNIDPVLDGERAHCLINGLFIGDGDQHMDNMMRVVHAQPNCDSRQFYKGILDDRARGVFSGRIIVAKDAQKTDAKQTNANLLLSDDAQIDTKPQLEIYADDVKCTHGATVGQIDEDALFYLRSRGIDSEAARAMMIYAFAAESFERMQLRPIRDTLTKALFKKLHEGQLLQAVIG
jgi:Fe-S cluster assembly protein SufD